ncbi:MAG TPA: DUF502 domain-containing protein [Opitutales bacterium]|nr:DUF502 domain-containing protein [Opitutales bacterium]
MNPSPSPLNVNDHASRWARLTNAFITGLFLLAPVGVCLFIINFLLVNVGEPASNVFFGWMGWVQGSAGDSPLVNFILSVVAIFIVVAFITALGITSHYLFGRWLFRRIEKLIIQVPILGQVYRTTKQIIDTFQSQQKGGFDTVVMVEFPRAGLYSIGFLTKSAEGEIRARTGEDFVNVFVPTTPLPTAGFLVICREKDLIRLDMSVGDAMKLIISGGTVAPPYPTARLEKNNS